MANLNERAVSALASWIKKHSRILAIFILLFGGLLGDLCYRSTADFIATHQRTVFDVQTLKTDEENRKVREHAMDETVHQINDSISAVNQHLNNVDRAMTDLAEDFRQFKTSKEEENRLSLQIP